MKTRLLPRLLITLLGAAFILWAVGSLALGLLGERTSAVVTHIRRAGGERTDTVPNRYTYNISYTFTLPDGKKVDGVTRKIGGAAYIKADGTSKMTVRYFLAMPYINAPENPAPFSPGQLILAGAGMFLIVQMNRKQKAPE